MSMNPNIRIPMYLILSCNCKAMDRLRLSAPSASPLRSAPLGPRARAPKSRALALWAWPWPAGAAGQSTQTTVESTDWVWGPDLKLAANAILPLRHRVDQSRKYTSCMLSPPQTSLFSCLRPRTPPAYVETRRLPISGSCMLS
eukprot:1493568-Prymnesium_polylepis.2